MILPYFKEKWTQTNTTILLQENNPMWTSFYPHCLWIEFLSKINFSSTVQCRIRSRALACLLVLIPLSLQAACLINLYQLGVRIHKWLDPVYHILVRPRPCLPHWLAGILWHNAPLNARADPTCRPWWLNCFSQISLQIFVAMQVKVSWNSV